MSKHLVPAGDTIAATEVWLDKQDILTRLHISSRTLQEWRNKKLITYSKIGGKIWYLESGLLDLLHSNMVKAERRK